MAENIVDAKQRYNVFDDPPETAPTAWQWVGGSGDNPARALVNLGTIVNPDNYSAGNLRHARPFICNGLDIFVFPGGTEGFTASGEAELGIHKYIGDNAADAVVIHKEEGRIEMTGTFAGNRSVANMVALRDLLMGQSFDPGLILVIPGVFPKEQFVAAERWEFTHADDDRSHSIGYTLTFLRVGVSHRAPDPHGTAPKPNPTTKIVTKKKPTNKAGQGGGGGGGKMITAAADGAQTFRQISALVYGDVDQWQRLVAQNLEIVDGIAAYQIPTLRLPIGTLVAY